MMIFWSFKTKKIKVLFIMKIVLYRRISSVAKTYACVKRSVKALLEFLYLNNYYIYFEKLKKPISV